MKVKKYKKQKQSDPLGLNGPGSMANVIKDPFIYTEEIVYNLASDPYWKDNYLSHIYVLRDLDRIFPFGLLAIEFLRTTKVSVISTFETKKEDHKQSAEKNSQFIFNSDSPDYADKSPSDIIEPYIYY